MLLEFMASDSIWARKGFQDQLYQKSQEIHTIEALGSFCQCDLMSISLVYLFRIHLIYGSIHSFWSIYLGSGYRGHSKLCSEIYSEICCFLYIPPREYQSFGRHGKCSDRLGENNRIWDWSWYVFLGTLMHLWNLQSRHRHGSTYRTIVSVPW